MTQTERRIVRRRDLVGWKAIAAALDVSVRTAQRWATRPPSEGGPPISRTPAGKPAARSEELIEWFEAGSWRTA